MYFTRGGMWNVIVFPIILAMLSAVVVVSWLQEIRHWQVYQGIYVLLLAAVSAVVTIRERPLPNPWKALYVVAVCCLVFLEIRTMRISAKDSEDRFNETVGSITGGDSWVYLEPLPKLRLVNGNRKHTVRKVGITVTDLDAVRRANPNGPFPVEIPLTAPQQCGDISKWGAYVVPGTVKLDVTQGAPVQHYVIDLQSENGKWRERLKVMSVNGEWKTAIKVVAMDLNVEEEGNLLLEKHDDGFPTFDGTIDWN
jgi:hypothetical protein